MQNLSKYVHHCLFMHIIMSIMCIIRTFELLYINFSLFLHLYHYITYIIRISRKPYLHLSVIQQFISNNSCYHRCAMNSGAWEDPSVVHEKWRAHLEVIFERAFELGQPLLCRGDTIGLQMIPNAKDAAFELTLCKGLKLSAFKFCNFVKNWWSVTKTP